MDHLWASLLLKCEYLQYVISIDVHTRVAEYAFVNQGYWSFFVIIQNIGASLKDVINQIKPANSSVIKMKKQLLLILMASIGLLSACAEIRHTNKIIHQDAKKAVKEIGHAGRNVGEEIKKTTKKAVKDISD